MRLFAVCGRRILIKCTRLLQWHFFKFFVRPQNVCVADSFSTELLNYWTGKRKRIEVSAKGPPFVYPTFNVRYKTGREYRIPPLNFFSAL